MYLIRTRLKDRIAGRKHDEDKPLSKEAIAAITHHS
jgi:hypothetical protein